MVAGAYILGCSGPRLTPEEAEFFGKSDPFGFILFARNIETPDQVRALTDELRASVGRNAPILIDQEGGRVERLTPPHWRTWPPPLEQKGGPRAFWLRARIIAHELCAIGISANCAPLGDIANATTHPVLKNRCYGTDPATVAANARATADGLAAGGILPVLKHIPGHGRAQIDSHKDLPRTDAPMDVLRTTDFAPFAALSDLPVAMSAHQVFTAIDSRSATQSPVIINLIRDEIGFDGLLLSDDISMEALDGDPGERGRAALDAGCDIVLHCNGKMPEMRQIAGLGPMTTEAARRAECALASQRPPEPVDITALQAEFDAISSDSTGQ